MDSAEAQVVAAFRRAFLADRAAGAIGSLQSYQERWPGHEAAIAAAFAQLAPDPAVDAAARFRRVRAAFERAIELPAAERDAALRAEFGDDDPLRRDVERLLAAEAGDGEFLTPPGAATLGGTFAPVAGGPAPGDRLGAYELVEQLGSGGQGTVWSAVDTRVGRKVALKLLPAVGAWNEAALLRFRREASIASRLEHPGICTVYDVDLEAGQPYVAMRLVDGQSLAERLADVRTGRTGLPVAAAVRYVEAAARALHAAHEVGIVHRDVKPGNLMVGQDDQVVVLDFGIAHELEDHGPQLTRTGDVFGTPAYMAPEQIDGGGVDARTDVWALGVTLFELIAGRQPFREPTREGLYRAILGREPALPRELAVPTDLRVIVATALQKEPARRYATARDLADDLAAFAAGRPIAARPVGAFGRLWRWARREPLAALLTAALVLALLTAAGVSGYLAAQRGRLAAGAAAMANRERAELLRDLRAGVLRLEQGEPKVRAVLAEAPQLTSPRAVLALGLAENGKIDEALTLCDAAPPDQEDPRALQRARALVLRHGKRGAEADALEADLGAPRSALEAYLASLGPDLDGRPDADRRALDHILQAIAFMPGASETYLERLVLCASGADALPELQRAAAALELLFPDSALAWFYIGLARSRSDPAGSRAANRRAIELDAGLAQPYVIEHYFLMTEGRYDAARDVFERGLALARSPPERQKLLIVRANSCLSGDRFAEALDAAERALAIHDRSVTVLLLMARAQRGLGDPGADATLRRVLELQPDNADAKALLGG